MLSCEAIAPHTFHPNQSDRLRFLSSFLDVYRNPVDCPVGICVSLESLVRMDYK
jgi:hypothetical protein